MSTTTNFMDPYRDPTPPELKASSNSRSNANKRKRPSDPSDPDPRSATARRTSSNTAPTANMADNGGNTSGFGGDDSHDFGLSALQSSTQNGPHDNHSHHRGPGGGGGDALTNLDAAAAALSQSRHYSMQVPPHPAEGFMNQPTSGPPDYGMEGGAGQDYSMGGVEHDTPGGPGSHKPAVGSDEWHKVRKDNHKEVERRRRETINEGINELSKIVPGCEKNKGSILARAVQYIQRLHDDASANIDKWTFEKMVTETAIAEISEKQTRAVFEREAWKNVAREAGVDVESDDVARGVKEKVDERVKQAQEAQREGRAATAATKRAGEADETGGAAGTASAAADE